LHKQAVGGTDVVNISENVQGVRKRTPLFFSFRLLSAGYDFGMDLVYVKRYVRKQ